MILKEFVNCDKNQRPFKALYKNARNVRFVLFRKNSNEFPSSIPSFCVFNCFINFEVFCSIYSLVQSDQQVLCAEKPKERVEVVALLVVTLLFWLLFFLRSSIFEVTCKQLEVLKQSVRPIQNERNVGI